MMHSTSSTLAAAALLLTLCACSGEPPPEGCIEGDTRACYSGPEGTAGVGVCEAGTQTCQGGVWTDCVGEVLPSPETCGKGVDSDCNGEEDETLNACGGCAQLAGAPGASCAGCGTWACAGEDAVSCEAPTPAPGSACTGPDGCPGSWTCDEAGEPQMVCDAPSRNACGLCGGPDINGLGDACTGTDGCAGALVCSSNGEETICDAPSRNACGVCGGPDITGLGDACVGTDGCEGTLVCSSSGEQTVCDAPLKNACGTCGGPDLPLLGSACTSANGCTGLMTCNTAGDALLCDAPPVNACGACAPPITGLGDACAAPNGCQGTQVCDAMGTGTVCTTQLVPNECGVCGGPSVANVGASCTNSDGCSGQMACNSAGNAVLCNAPAINACGVCGPPVSGLGDACTSSQGCPGTLFCRADGQAAECVSMLTPNECGLCGGAPVAGVGDPCVDATSGCAGALVCNATADDTVCSATCGTSHVVISELSTGHTHPDDEFIELYNPTNAPVNLGGWKLQFKPAAGGGFSDVYVIPAGTTVAATGYLLIASGSYGGAPQADASWGSAFNLPSAGGHVRVALPGAGSAPADPAAVDRVGYGAAADAAEGSPISSNSPATGSYERKAASMSTSTSMAPGGSDALRGNGWDTDDNAADFVTRGTRQPQGTASGTEAP